LESRNVHESLEFNGLTVVFSLYTLLTNNWLPLDAMMVSFGLLTVASSVAVAPDEPSMLPATTTDTAVAAIASFAITPMLATTVATAIVEAVEATVTLAVLMAWIATCCSTFLL
jgi:hypothetical protein